MEKLQDCLLIMEIQILAPSTGDQHPFVFGFSLCLQLLYGGGGSLNEATWTKRTEVPPSENSVIRSNH